MKPPLLHVVYSDNHSKASVSVSSNESIITHRFSSTPPGNWPIVILQAAMSLLEPQGYTYHSIENSNTYIFTKPKP